MIERNEEKCCGCSACVTICPKKAIYFKQMENGFFYPKINEDKCIGCGLCDHVCRFLKKNDKSKCPSAIYGAIKINNREKSQSGGAFTTIAEEILLNNGIVYGVVNQNNEVKYLRGTSLAELQYMKGSKYVQAKIDNIFKEVELDLKNKRLVLFSGTPCIIDGLYGYLKVKNIDISQLYTCDLICHGVPSPKIYQDYIIYLGNEYGQISKFNFRNKKLSKWKGHICSCYSSQKGNLVLLNYPNIFYSNVVFRESCYVCPYSSTKRCADITVGDFWGIENVNKKFDDNKGCSLVMINSDKGKEIWEHCKKKMSFFESNISQCYQPNLYHPTRKPQFYEEFWKLYKDKKFENAVTTYCGFYKKNDMTLFQYKILKIKKIVFKVMKKFGLISRR